MEGRDDGGVDVTAVQTLGKKHTDRTTWLVKNPLTLSHGVWPCLKNKGMVGVMGVRLSDSVKLE